ncbi:MAG: 4Fe-4S dicluster domain-containing protein [Deltaproteobacteria bacterium]|nr:4Fe-4S dicluster domain-containing protein [Deltaproteobacteria bacterium]
MGLIQKQYDSLRKKIKKSELENQRRAFKETRNRQKQNLHLFKDFEKMKEEVKRIRSQSMGNQGLLEEAIAHLEKNRFKVLRAKDGEEACLLFLKEIGEEKLIVKSKSNLSKEIGLTPFLVKHGIEIIETDIGDRINQLIGGRSSHYTGPVAHLTRYEIAEVLSKHLKREIPPVPEEEMQAVREDIESYLQRAKVGITGANAIAASEGAILIIHNEGNVTRVRTRSKHLIIASIDKIYPDMNDAILMAKLETFLATGSIFPSFIDIVGGRSKSSDVEKIPFYGMHEPNELVIILLDHGRSWILEKMKDFTDLLYCIGCGNCLLDCPTYNSIGPSFGADGMLGGRGVALSSLMHGMREGVEDGLFLCTTCGLCGEVCPVGIDAGKRLKDLRRLSLKSKEVSSELDEVTQLQSTIDRFGTPYGEMERAQFPSLKKKAPIVLYVGCVGLTTEAETTARVVELLQRLGVEFAMIDEVCCEAVKGDTGSSPNPERIQKNIERIKETGGREVLFTCPTCLKTFLEYGEKHSTELVFKDFLSYLTGDFNIKVSDSDSATITYHDPCHLGRGLGSFDGARELLRSIGAKFVEMEHHHRESLCCGAGGGVRGFYPKFSRDIARRRVKEAEEVRADILLTDCLSCKHNLRQGVPLDGKTKVMTTPEYLLERIKTGKVTSSRK